MPASSKQSSDLKLKIVEKSSQQQNSCAEKDYDASISIQPSNSSVMRKEKRECKVLKLMPDQEIDKSKLIFSWFNPFSP